MAEPLLDFLTGRARAALPFLRYAAARNLPASIANDILRQLGGGLQTQRIGDIYAVLQNRANAERVARLTGENGIIPIDLHVASPNELSSNYQYVIQAVINNEATGDFLTVSSDIPLSPGQIRAQGVFLFNRSDYRDLELGPVVADDIQIVELNRNPL